MATAGRKPKPAADKRTRGNPGNRPIPPEPDFAGGDTLGPPKRWPAEGYEREEWNRIVPELVRCKIAKAVHQGALEKICELYASGVELYERKDYTGSRMAAGEYRKALNEFGLTAASAGRVGTQGSHGDKDPAEAFFSGPRAVND
jgi:hypothetical protein